MKRKIADYAACCVVLFTLNLSAQDVFLQISETSGSNFSAARETVRPAKDWSEYTSVGEILESYMPVQFKSSGFGSTELLKIRGQSRGIQFYLDGAPLPMDASGFTDMSVIPTPIIERIEVQKSFSASWADGAGTVYIYTKKPIAGANIIDANTEVSAYKTSLFSLGWQSSLKKIPFKVIYAQNISDGFQENGDFDKKTFNVSSELPWNYAPLLSYIYSENYMGLPGGTRVPISEWNGSKERSALTPDDWQQDKLHTLSLSNDYKKLHYGAAYSQLDRESFMEAWPTVTQLSTREASAKVQYAVTKKLTLGLDYRFSALKKNSLHLS